MKKLLVAVSLLVACSKSSAPVTDVSVVEAAVDAPVVSDVPAAVSPADVPSATSPAEAGSP